MELKGFNNTKLIDKINRKILGQLEINARQSNEAIAKKLSISKQTVQNRLTKMTEAGLVLGYWAAINFGALGYMSSSLFLRLKNMSYEKEQEFLQKLKADKCAIWVAEIIGNWDISVSIAYTDILEMEDTLNNISNKYGVYIDEMRIYQNIDSCIMPFKFLYFEVDSSFKDAVMGFMFTKKEQVKIDEIDRKILSLLSGNARMALIDIANNVKVSSNTIKYRIKNLKENRVIMGFRPVINYNAIHYHWFQCIIHVNSYNPELKERFLRYLKINPYVTCIINNIGQMMSIDVLAPNIVEFDKIKMSLKKEFSELIKSFNVLSIVKIHKRRLLPI